MNLRALTTLVTLLVLSAAACDSAALKANQEQVQQNQQQLEQQAKEIAELKSQQGYQTPQPLPGCDRDVMARATRDGGDHYASGDFSKALGYYQDALTACPGNARAELNIGRAYEALNDRQQALTHYQQAASSGDPTETAAEQEAHTDADRLSAVAP